MNIDVSILRSISQSDVRSEPFAYAVAENVVDEPGYESLQSSFPPLSRFVEGLPSVASNQAIRIPARDIIGNPEFASDWRYFFEYHTSPDFWRDILRVFGDSLLAMHPGIEAKAGKPLNKWSVTRRGAGEQGDVSLDALFVVNTPVTKLSSVRPAHVDSENEIWAGLYYMRAKDEDASGGDLALYRFRGDPAFGGHYAPLSAVSEEQLVPYTANRFVGFVNSAKSIHGVTPREPTSRHRRYINFVAITPFKAFSLPMMSRWSQFKFWLERRNSKASGVMARPLRSR